jgi:hypothetical protein
MGSAVGSEFSEPFATGRGHWQVAYLIAMASGQKSEFNITSVSPS